MLEKFKTVGVQLGVQRNKNIVTVIRYGEMGSSSSIKFHIQDPSGCVLKTCRVFCVCTKRII